MPGTSAVPADGVASSSATSAGVTQPPTTSTGRLLFHTLSKPYYIV